MLSVLSYLLFVGALFLLILWLPFIWLRSVLQFCVAKWQKQPEIARRAERTLAWSSGILFPIGTFIWLEFFPPAPMIYRSAYRENPALDVENLRGSAPSNFGGGAKFLQFKTEQTTIRHLAGRRNLPRVTLAEFEVGRFSYSGSRPQWWKPETNADSWIYHSQKVIDSSSEEAESLIYNPRTQVAYYSYVGPDVD